MLRSFISSILLALMLFSQFYNSVIWIKYELNVEEITELFCVNKEKPVLMCNGKCYIKGELIDIDIFPQSPQTPVTEVSYLPAIKLYVIQESVNVAILLVDLLKSNHSAYSVYWESKTPEPPFIPPQLLA
ncbi:MAG: hypothetical protein L3J29_08725 [Cyclobacteriaceae bacterium]|nr:hypothetical protein [Cyclobacteriaceae bacterium]